ncbi:MAG: ATP-binding protein [Desulfuromonadaceae bacterium]|nr:ATP-binding protein [Desulfuromonadaceae bacterium]
MSHSILPAKSSLLLLLLLALLLIFFKGPNLLYGALSLLAVTIYYFFTDHQFTPDQISRHGYLGIHLFVYILLCTTVIWATTGDEESHYWIVYLLPIVTAASVLSLGRTLWLCALSSLLYLALIPATIYLDSTELREDLPEFIISSISLFAIGILVHSLAEQNRHKLQQEKQLNYQLSTNEEALRQSLKKLKETEESLRRQDRLAALGEISAGLAHEIRNPLGIITSSAQLLSSPTQDYSDPTLMTIIQEEATRLNNLISRFLDFGSPLHLQRSPCQLNEFLTQILDHVRGLASSKDIVLTTAFPTTPITLLVDTELLHQTVVNLLLNALEACQAGDHITLSFCRRGHHIRISVKDSGRGIAEQELKQIFIPFFTTREGGSGLGLANAHKAMTLHGGTIEAHSRLGHGSTFTLVLPLKENSPCHTS